MGFTYFIEVNGIWHDTDNKTWNNFNGRKKIKAGFVTEYFEGKKKVKEYNIASLLCGFRY